MLYPPLLSVGRTQLAVTRRSLPTKDRGRYTEGTSEVVTITCNVQPILKSTDTMLLPEADRSKACLKVYTKGAEIRGMKEGPGGHDADQFMWQGELYEVMKAINYQMGVLNHYKAVCMRKELT